MPVSAGSAINAQDIVNTFSSYVVSVANGGIVWASNNKPFVDMPDNYFGGTNTGKSIGITGSNIGSPGIITASTIYSVLLSETVSYTRIRRMRAILQVQGDPLPYTAPYYDAYGNLAGYVTVTPPYYSGPGKSSKGSTGGPDAITFDQTQLAYLNSSYDQSLSAERPGIFSGNQITASNLINFFNNLASAYNSAKLNTITVQINVCHNSCHSSCHGSRGRR